MWARLNRGQGARRRRADARRRERTRLRLQGPWVADSAMTRINIEAHAGSQHEDCSTSHVQTTCICAREFEMVMLDASPRLDLRRHLLAAPWCRFRFAVDDQARRLGPLKRTVAVGTRVRKRA